MTYSAIVMWLWVVALGATAAGLVVAARALSRADAAVACLHVATEAVAAVPGAQRALDRATAEAARHRVGLHDRAAHRS